MRRTDPYPPHTPRALPLRTATGLLLGVALTATGCAGGTPTARHTAAAPSVSGTPSASAPNVADSTPPAAPPVSLTVDQLVAALPARPAGAKAWATKTVTGALTQEQYVMAEFGSKGPELLPVEQQRGLQFGARRNWRTPGGVLVDVFIADFTERTGALSDYLALTSGEKADDAGDTDFTLPGVTDSFGTANPKLDNYGYAGVTVHAVAGNLMLRVTMNAPAAPDQADATAVAAQLYKNLCKLTDCTSGNAS
jgi:hypothetical protein